MNSEPVVVIKSVSDLEAAIKWATAADHAKARWYVARMAHAFKRSDLIPKDWDSTEVGSFREQPIRSEDELRKSAAIDKAVDAFADTVEDLQAKNATQEDAEAVVASILGMADKDGVYDEAMEAIVAGAQVYVEENFISDETMSALIAAADKVRRVRTQAGVRRYKAPIGTPIVRNARTGKLEADRSKGRLDAPTKSVGSTKVDAASKPVVTRATDLEDGDELLHKDGTTRVVTDVQKTSNGVKITVEDEDGKSETYDIPGTGRLNVLRDESDDVEDAPDDDSKDEKAAEKAPEAKKPAKYPVDGKSQREKLERLTNRESLRSKSDEELDELIEFAEAQMRAHPGDSIEADALKRGAKSAKAWKIKNGIKPDENRADPTSTMSDGELDFQIDGHRRRISQLEARMIRDRSANSPRNSAKLRTDRAELARLESIKASREADKKNPPKAAEAKKADEPKKDAPKAEEPKKDDDAAARAADRRFAQSEAEEKAVQTAQNKFKDAVKDADSYDSDDKSVAAEKARLRQIEAKIAVGRAIATRDQNAYENGEITDAEADKRRTRWDRNNRMAEDAKKHREKNVKAAEEREAKAAKAAEEKKAKDDAKAAKAEAPKPAAEAPKDQDRTRSDAALHEARVLGVTRAQAESEADRLPDRTELRVKAAEAKLAYGNALRDTVNARLADGVFTQEQHDQNHATLDVEIANAQAALDDAKKAHQARLDDEAANPERTDLLARRRQLQFENGLPSARRRNEPELRRIAHELQVLEDQAKERDKTGRHSPNAARETSVAREERFRSEESTRRTTRDREEQAQTWAEAQERSVTNADQTPDERLAALSSAYDDHIEGGHETGQRAQHVARANALHKLVVAAREDAAEKPKKEDERKLQGDAERHAAAATSSKLDSMGTSDRPAQQRVDAAKAAKADYLSGDASDEVRNHPNTIRQLNAFDGLIDTFQREADEESRKASAEAAASAKDDREAAAKRAQAKRDAIKAENAKAEADAPDADNEAAAQASRAEYEADKAADQENAAARFIAADDAHQTAFNDGPAKGESRAAWVNRVNDLYNTSAQARREAYPEEEQILQDQREYAEGVRQARADYDAEHGVENAAARFEAADAEAKRTAQIGQQRGSTRQERHQAELARIRRVAAIADLEIAESDAKRNGTEARTPEVAEVPEPPKATPDVPADDNGAPVFRVGRGYQRWVISSENADGTVNLAPAPGAAPASGKARNRKNVDRSKLIDAPAAAAPSAPAAVTEREATPAAKADLGNAKDSSGNALYADRGYHVGRGYQTWRVDSVNADGTVNLSPTDGGPRRRWNVASNKLIAEGSTERTKVAKPKVTPRSAERKASTAEALADMRAKVEAQPDAPEAAETTPAPHPTPAPKAAETVTTAAQGKKGMSPRVYAALISATEGAVNRQEAKVQDGTATDQDRKELAANKKELERLRGERDAGTRVDVDAVVDRRTAEAPATPEEAAPEDEIAPPRPEPANAPTGPVDEWGSPVSEWADIDNDTLNALLDGYLQEGQMDSDDMRTLLEERGNRDGTTATIPQEYEGLDSDTLNMLALDSASQGNWADVANIRRTMTATDDERKLDKMSRLMAEGMNPIDAEVEAFGGDRKKILNREIASYLRQHYSMRRVDGNRFEEMLAAAYRQELEEEIIRAENATNGYFYSNDGNRRHTDTGEGLASSDELSRMLWTQNEATARRNASDELRAYWDAHGRLTKEAFRARIIQTLTGERTMGPGRDFLT
jgi:hypothetical protein